MCSTGGVPNIKVLEGLLRKESIGVRKGYRTTTQPRKGSTRKVPKATLQDGFEVSEGGQLSPRYQGTLEKTVWMCFFLDFTFLLFVGSFLVLV